MHFRYTMFYQVDFWPVRTLFWQCMHAIPFSSPAVRCVPGIFPGFQRPPHLLSFRPASVFFHIISPRRHIFFPKMHFAR